MTYVANLVWRGEHEQPIHVYPLRVRLHLVPTVTTNASQLSLFENFIGFEFSLSFFFFSRSPQMRAPIIVPIVSTPAAAAAAAATATTAAAATTASTMAEDEIDYSDDEYVPKVPEAPQLPPASPSSAPSSAASSPGHNGSAMETNGPAMEANGSEMDADGSAMEVEPATTKPAVTGNQETQIQRVSASAALAYRKTGALSAESLPAGVPWIPSKEVHRQRDRTSALVGLRDKSAPDNDQFVTGRPGLVETIATFGNAMEVAQTWRQAHGIKKDDKVVMSLTHVSSRRRQKEMMRQLPPSRTYQTLPEAQVSEVEGEDEEMTDAVANTPASDKNLPPVTPSTNQSTRRPYQPRHPPSSKGGRNDSSRGGPKSGGGRGSHGGRD
ncbi:hypothetical protein M426DRAFT_263817, partial [Hypoxylon sp. CI-4A]